MISTFNLTDLNELLKDFYTLTKIRITVFDETFKELTAYPKEYSAFCEIIRTDKQADEKCQKCDREACRIASNRRSPYTYQCHAGLTESITPLYLGNILIGYLFFGQVFSYPSHDEGWKKIQKLCKDYRLDFQDLKDACFERPIISEDYIASASHILHAVASYLSLERKAIFKQKELPVLIDEYISEHYTEDINAASICAHFQIGKTYLYEIARECYNVGIAEHIRNLRIDKAKALLTGHPHMQISRIASECGFSDYNYFITVFKRVTGVSPKVYRTGALQKVY